MEIDAWIEVGEHGYIHCVRFTYTNYKGQTLKSERYFTTTKELKEHMMRFVDGFSFGNDAPLYFKRDAATIFNTL